MKTLIVTFFAIASLVLASMAFAGSGTYPSTYAGGLFFADYSRDCIWAMLKGSNGLPDKSNRVTFVA